MPFSKSRFHLGELESLVLVFTLAFIGGSFLGKIFSLGFLGEIFSVDFLGDIFSLGILGEIFSVDFLGEIFSSGFLGDLSSSAICGYLGEVYGGGGSTGVGKDWENT